MLWVVELVTWHLSLVLSTYALLLHHHLALSALIVMTSLRALMSCACQKFLASSLTDWDFVDAIPSLLAYERHDFLSAARAVLHSSRSLLARLAVSFMAHFLASVLSTVQCFVAYLLADKSLATTFDSPLFFPAEARHFDINVTFLANALVTGGFAVMVEAIQ